MSAAFTPGPWYLKPCRVGDEQRHRVVWGAAAPGYPDRALCHTTGKRPAENNDANARLIAAAPELYEALEALLTYAAGDDREGLPVFEQADTALAKARGDTL